MKEKKRSFGVLKFIFIILLHIIFLIISSKAIYYNLSLNCDKIIVSDYEIKKENSELLKLVADEVIEEGKDINIKKIPIDKINYTIYNNEDGNIIFKYYLKDYSKNENKYPSTIVLSSDFIIISENHDLVLDSFVEYEQNMCRSNKVLSIVFGILIIVIFYLVIIIIWSVLEVIKFIKNNYNK